MAETSTPALTVADLEVFATGGRLLLQVPRLSIAPGTLVGIRGPSGAGKSTLLMALAGLSGRARGAVSWGGLDLLGCSQRARSAFRMRHIGLIFQDFQLFEELNAAANASLAALFSPRERRATVRDRARLHLDGLGIAETPRPVQSFSGGERQRVAIARALANDAAIVLADEPTASLHREAADDLTRDLVATARQEAKTLIAISHDPGLLDRMDRVLQIEDGRIVGEHAG